MRVLLALTCSLFLLSACNGQSESLNPKSVKEDGIQNLTDRSLDKERKELSDPVESETADALAIPDTEQIHINALLGKIKPSTDRKSVV